jgi:hypothetical protein
MFGHMAAFDFDLGFFSYLIDWFGLSGSGATSDAGGTSASAIANSPIGA